jgi:hypothetical protein
VRYKPKHGSSRNGTRYTYRKGSKVWNQVQKKH